MKKFIPKKGLKVINPDTMKKVPEEGVLLPKVTDYWKRREKDEDGEIVDVPKKQKAVTQESTKKEEKDK